MPKPGALALLIGDDKPMKGKPEQDEDDGADYDEALNAAADDLLAAIEAKDAAGVASALRAAHEACAMGAE
jgi:hypothetical protein